MSDDKIEKRVSELEIQITQQNHTIDELNESVVSQWKEIDRLTRVLKSLNEQVLSLEDGSGAKSTKPPHF